MEQFEGDEGVETLIFDAFFALEGLPRSGIAPVLPHHRWLARRHKPSESHRRRRETQISPVEGVCHRQFLPVFAKSSFVRRFPRLPVTTDLARPKSSDFRGSGFRREKERFSRATGNFVRKSSNLATQVAGARPKKDIPWLLVKVKPEQGDAGTFSSVVYIQRLQTEGGIAPAEHPRRLGTKVGVSYKAVYYFYGKAND